MLGDAVILSEAEREVMLGLAAALVSPHPGLYSATLGDIVMGRQLAAHVVGQVLLDCAQDLETEPVIRAVCFALARELAGAVRAVDAVEAGHPEAALVFDAPLGQIPPPATGQETA